MVPGDQKPPQSKRFVSRTTEREATMSFQFQPSDLADSTLVPLSAPQKKEFTLNSGWWMLPFLSSGALFWFWFVPTVAQNLS